MKKEQISTKLAPAAIGPYSQAVRVGDLVFTSGQLPSDVETSQIVSGGIEAQTHQVFKNLKVVLETAKTSLAQVVKATVFLKNMDDFAAVNAIYATYFPANSILPARSAVQVARLPKDALIEIEVIAVVSQ
ncbi:MAG: RidA family protein [Sphaerochaetaceae bacterium]|jgi:2-iminobutanoate/2-iminopropanoate deaminase|nr:RidA family protein [Sphaerochaetaceae bacterium]